MSKIPSNEKSEFRENSFENSIEFSAFRLSFDPIKILLLNFLLLKYYNLFI